MVDYPDFVDEIALELIYLNNWFFALLLIVLIGVFYYYIKDFRR